ncbi:MMPL family transporter [Streptomyces sp. NBC_00435]|uniref:MMPL family transporter n=1 Tax=Streptomyces sp. NBC_00435 TaxID=2903649 RepID=UPI002E240919
MSALARWCFRHRWSVVLLWLVLLVSATSASSALGNRFANDFNLPDSDSARALKLLDKAFPNQNGETDTIVWHIREGSVRDAAPKERVERMLADLGKLPDVANVASPFAEGGATQISADGRTAYAPVTFSKSGEKLTAEQMKEFVATAKAAGQGTGLQVEAGGDAINLAEEEGGHTAELVGVVAAAVVLFLAFGSLFGMLLPLVTAIFGVGTAISVIGLLSHAITMADLSSILATLVGLGVGIDYALFVVTRHRKGLLQGLDPEEAAVRAVNTSGRAVVFAGGTVCVALLGMFTMRLKFLNGVAIGSALTVVLTVAASITLLPALLGILRMRVLSRRQRRRLAADGPVAAGTSGAAARWSALVQKRPWPLAVLALLVMAAISLPTLSLRLGSSDQGNNPDTTTTRKAYDLLADGFGPGFNGPLTIVAETPAAADHAALSTLVLKLKEVPGIAEVVAVPAAPDATVALVRVVPTTSPQAEETDELIDRLRSDVIPPVERGTTLRAHVGGQTALFKDFATVLEHRLPLFIGVIVALGFVLLLLAFRSLVVPLTAALMNLIAAAASFGLLVALFQWGWGGEAVAAGRAGPIESFLPMIMLSLLFGLSMDYQVFLVSRMHEEWVHSGDNARAVRVGLAETSRVINSAAVIMICVFSAFVLNGERQMAMFGIGLAGAVAMDAFVLRTVLVPALMHVLGRANWWLPAWLDRALPHVAVEPAEEPVSAAADQREPVGAGDRA